MRAPFAGSAASRGIADNHTDHTCSFRQCLHRRRAMLDGSVLQAAGRPRTTSIRSLACLLSRSFERNRYCRTKRPASREPPIIGRDSIERRLSSVAATLRNHPAGRRRGITVGDTAKINIRLRRQSREPGHHRGAELPAELLGDCGNHLGVCVLDPHRTRSIHRVVGPRSEKSQTRGNSVASECCCPNPKAGRWARGRYLVRAGRW